MHTSQQVAPKPAILVVGGAGFIGSHMVALLQTAGYEPIILDLKQPNTDATWVVGDMGDEALLTSLFERYRFSVVMHFASYINVAESVTTPLKYYQNNLAKTLTLLGCMLKQNCPYLIFSSTAAVYGEPHYTPIDEQHGIAPINPYGRTKWMVEEMIKDFAASHGLRYAILRYFNASGAHPDGHLGEAHSPECHLVPLLLQVAQGIREHITIYGKDYPTEDGTCIRDYVHVADLCQAHLLALDYLRAQSHNLICNLGAGRGYSVQEVIQTAEQVTAKSIPMQIGAKRSGDPAILVADTRLAQQLLDWRPAYSDLPTMITHAWHYMRHTKPSQ